MYKAELIYLMVAGSCIRVLLPNRVIIILIVNNNENDQPPVIVARMPKGRARKAIKLERKSPPHDQRQARYCN